MSYFIFNNTNSNTLGIIVNKLPPRIIPEERKELLEVPGRNGYLTIKENTYAPITLPIECTLKAGANIDEIAKVLKGTGKLILSDDETRYYDAEIVNSIPFERILRHWKRFIIQFNCQPFMKSITETIKTLSIGNNVINILGTGITNPIIEIIGNGNYKLTINDKAIILTGINPNIKLDSELMNAVSIDGLQNLNSKMQGEFIPLINGNNTVKVEVVAGTLTSIKMKYKEAWL